MKCTSSNKFTTMTLEEPESPDVSVEFVVARVEWSDKVAASSMDELV